MALSEEEQRLLDELERGLYQNDVDIVSTSGGRSFDPKRILFGILIAVIGVIALLVGIIMHQPIIGLVGFAIMFGGALFAFTGKKNGKTPGSSGSGSGTGPRSAPKESWEDRANRRWDDIGR